MTLRVPGSVLRWRRRGAVFAICAVTLAIGIAVSTAMFTLVDDVDE